MFITLPSRLVVPASGTRKGVAGMLAEIGEGLRFLWRDRLLRTLSLTITVLAGAWSAWLALMPSYATAVLEADPRGYGLLISAIGLGGLAGAGTTAVVNRLLGVRWALFADLVGTFLMMVVPALFPAAWAVGVAVFAVAVAALTVPFLWNVTAAELRRAAESDNGEG
jgi:predicted MFS family arabinose efflux permease